MKKLITLVLALALVAVAFCASAESYNVGVVQLMPHVALDAATQGFLDRLTELLGEENVTFDVKIAGEAGNCTPIANGFAADNVDLIFANATPALLAASQATSDIPILGTAITSYGVALGIEMDDAAGTGINVSGTSDLAPLDEQAAMIMELFPDAKNVGLLYCSAEANSKYQIDAVRAALEASGITCKEYTFTDSNDIAAVTTTAAAESDVIYVPTDNTAATYAETIANVVIPEGVPVVAGEEGICAGCGVATLTISYYDIGYATGDMAYEILVNGADVSTMGIQFAPQFTKKYNFDIVDALGIDIPDDYVAIEG